ncbi:MAG: hypothetical protein NWE86_02595, partial [Candidatus Bathyarchaeota archaeon]|nr:hypothetical protein [Candidatus Bathyarchaeota archaeon]
GVSHLGSYPNIEFVKLDLNTIEKTAEIIKEINPNIIMHNATMMSNLEWARLPEEITSKLISAGISNIVPCHLTLTYKLMKSVQISKTDAHVVMSPYPDVVNAALGKFGLAQNLIGLGNIDYIVPGIQKAAADKFKVSVQNVLVFLVAPYALLNYIFRYGNTGDLPYFLKIVVKGKDVTKELDIRELLKEVSGYLSLLTINDLGFIAASSGVKNALAILNDSGIFTHAPGPLGLPGGYPIILNEKGASLALPEELTQEEAVKINQRVIKEVDGVERIEDNGTTVFTDKCADAWREVFNYDCKELKIEDSEKRAKEILSIHKEFVKSQVR